MLTINIDDEQLRPLIQEIVREEVLRLKDNIRQILEPRTQQESNLPPTAPMPFNVKDRTGADRKWGYPFGVEGCLPVEESCELTGGIHRETLKRKADAGLVRRGRHPSGRSLAYCRRSISEYPAQMEI